MANLPHQEGLNEENDVTLPLIEDLPFDSDINFEEADLKFMEQYGDLLDAVEVEDIGLITLIQPTSEEPQETVSTIETIDQPLPLTNEQSQSDDTGLGWLMENDANGSVSWEVKDEDLSDISIDLSWEGESIVSETPPGTPADQQPTETIGNLPSLQQEELTSIQDTTAEGATDNLTIFEPTEIFEEQTKLQSEEQPIDDLATLEEELTAIQSATAELPDIEPTLPFAAEEQTILQTTEEPIDDLATLEEELTAIQSATAELPDIEPTLPFPAEEQTTLQNTEEPIDDLATLEEELTAIQSATAELPDIEPTLPFPVEEQTTLQTTEETIDDLATLEEELTAIQYDNEEAQSLKQTQQVVEDEQDVDDLIDELETLLQVEDEEAEEASQSPSSFDLDELETLLQDEEEPTYQAEQVEQEQDSNLLELDELETLLQDEDENDNVRLSPSPVELPQNKSQSEPIPEESISAPIVDELNTLLQDEEGNDSSEEMIDWTVDEDESYSAELASVWETQESEEEAIESLLTGQQSYQGESIEDQYEDEYQFEYNEQSDQSEEQVMQYTHNQQDEYEYAITDDEDSAIDEIMTAFTGGRSADEQGEVEEDKATSEEYEYQYEYQQGYQEYQEQDYDQNYAYETAEYGEAEDYEQQTDWNASYSDESQTSEEDDYHEWQQGLQRNDFEVEIDDEDSAIDEIITTFQFEKETPSTQIVLDEEADAMVTKWQETEQDLNEDYASSDSGMIDWEKIAAGSSSHLEPPSPDFESFTIGHDPMETAIRAKNVLEKSKTSIKDSVEFKMEEDDMSLPPLPPIKTSRTEINPPPSIAMPTFADEFYEEELYQPRTKSSKSSKSSQVSSKRKDGIVLEDDSDLPYREQLKGKGKSKSFDTVDDDDWEDLLDDIPPVPPEMFGLSEQTAARYADSGTPSQFSDGFQSGDTEPANLNLGKPANPYGVSQTAPTFPETPPASVRVQQFFENNGKAILQIGKSIAIVVIPIGLLWGIFSHPRVNKAVTVTGLRMGIWKDVRGKNLRSVNLKGKNLTGVNFSGADLSGSDLSGANLRAAKLNGAKLEKTNLSGAKLNLADFSGANLKGANLSKSDISKTVFRGADLSSAKFSNRTWAPNNPPLSDNKTKCPNGRKGPCQF